jgi:uncharacterized membrane protein YedE/YeeE
MNQIYINALVGGLLIGSAAVLFLTLNGRIAGISGILWGALTHSGERLWRWLFLGGLLAGTMLAHAVFALPMPPANSLPTSAALVGGLLVGFGVKLGNGCTSGHGVCGIGLLSWRSLIATATFMGTGILTVFLLRHGGGLL